MATADELLSAAISGDSKIFVIDHYTRTINIPKSITNLGVESDDEVLRLHFSMPRYFGKTDLSKFAIRINYMNARGEDDVYKVTDAEVVGDDITFSWLVGPSATEYRGNTKFNVCMVITDANSVIQQEYNTTIATLPVLEGLECDERIVSEYSDILQQWENRLFGIADTEEAKLTTKSEEEQENIANKGAEVLASIPEDYTSTYKLAHDSVRTRANAIICSAEGDVVRITDGSDDYLRGLRIFGKTTQTNTTGAQLFDESTLITGYYANTEGGWVNTSSTVYRTIEIDIKNPGTYCISFGGMVAFIRENGNTINETGTTRVVELEAGVYRLSFRKHPSANWDNGYSIMFNAGATPLPYEQYSGGYVSPSPNWSQPLNSVGAAGLVGIATYGSKNLLNITTGGSAAGVTETVVNGLVSFSGTATGNGGRTAWKRSDVITLYPGVYHLSMNVPEGIAGEPCLTINNDTNIIAGEGRFTVYETTDVYLGFNYVADTIYNAKNVQVQLELGEEATDYEPYKSTQITNFAAPNVLPSIPVTTGGNYTDANGQQWICDEIDFARGVYVQRVYKLTVSEGTNWMTSGYKTANYNAFYRPNYSIPFMMKGTNNPILSTHFVTAEDGYSDCVHVAGGLNNQEIYYFVSNVDYPDTDVWSEYVVAQAEAGKPIEVQYILETPVETALTQEELEKFKMVSSIYPNTIVINDIGAWMEVTYNADTMTFLENLPKATDAQVAAAVDAWLTAHFTTAEGVSF